jgi:dTDP-4-amino-4,6-dideoxygalactose transaminase/glycosyltransferase involved in cell wall biosynthesis
VTVPPDGKLDLLGGATGSLGVADALTEPVVFGAPLVGEEEIEEVVRTLRSGWLGTGPKTRRFEHEFADFVGSRYAVATNSCTAALHLALLAYGVGPGDEVVTSPMTFVATANAIEHCGATPVFADVDELDCNIDRDEVARRVTSRTKAILPVHYAGAVCDVPALREQHPGLPIVVDAAHAIEATYKDGARSAQNGASCAAYSFYVTKNVTTGEGGMFVTDDEEMASNVRCRGLHGVDQDAWKRHSDRGYRSYEAVCPGFKYNMTDLQASLGLHQLARIESTHARRSAIWARYNEAFLDLPGVEVPPIALEPDRSGRHARHLYTLWIDWDVLGLERRDFVEALTGYGIGVGWHFRAVHLQPYYRERYGYEPGAFPVAERIGHKTISIPMSPALTDEQVNRVIAAVTTVARVRRTVSPSSTVEPAARRTHAARRSVGGRSRARVMVLLDTLASGGAERVAVELACGIDRLAYEPHVVVTKRGGPLEDRLIDAGVRYTVLGRRHRTSLAPALRALRFARESDLIHSHLFGNNVWGALLAQAAGVPLLAHEHNRVSRHTTFEPVLDRRLIGAAAHRIVCVSDEVAHPLVMTGVDPAKITILPNGVRLDDALSRADARRALTLADDYVVVGAVASLRPEKAHDVLLHAFSALVRSGPGPLRLCLVGDGSERARLQALALRLGIEDRVIWAGDRCDASCLAAAFDLAVLTSRSEGLPLAALEAMAAGTPLIGTRVGSIPALLEGGAGLLVDPDDSVGLARAMAALLYDRERAHELARRARSLIAERYELGSLVHRLEGIYEAALATADRGVGKAGITGEPSPRYSAPFLQARKR